jgi:hypothetical protein
MRRTRAFSAAAFFLLAFGLVEAPCLAQEPQAAVVVGSASVVAPADAAALSPGQSLYWTKTHLSAGEAGLSPQDAIVITDKVIQSNERRFCGVIYLAALLQMPDNNVSNHNVPSINPCP